MTEVTAILREDMRRWFLNQETELLRCEGYTDWLCVACTTELLCLLPLLPPLTPPLPPPLPSFCRCRYLLCSPDDRKEFLQAHQSDFNFKNEEISDMDDTVRGERERERKRVAIKTYFSYLP